MISLPSARRSLQTALLALFVVVVYRAATINSGTASLLQRASRLASQTQHGILVDMTELREYSLPFRNISQAHLTPHRKHYYDHTTPSKLPPADNPYLIPLFTCKARPNPHTNHVRLPNLVLNVSQSPPASPPDPIQKFNPTIIPLPYWSANHYLLVSRVVTEGLHQESLICEANLCHPSGYNGTSRDSTVCSPSDLEVLGPSGGLRCATSPVIINIPPTPAERCTGSWIAFPDIPGFHDPRIFWSGKGEPLIIVNSASRYACVGLWIVDLRTLYPPLQKLLAARRGQKRGPLMSYPHLTELTRNPRESRAEVEKNWMLFFPSRDEAFVHYDMTGHKGEGARSFAKLIGNGFTTPNLADPGEASCFDGTSVDRMEKIGHWHQGSNALKLVLCTRDEAKRGECREDEEGRTVHFAVMHRKFSNDWDLPLRYERYFVVWEGKAPFRLLARSQFPILFWNETASGWSGRENWESDEMRAEQKREWQHVRHNGTFLSKRPAGSLPLNATWHNGESAYADPQQNWAYFTYTPSIAWAWRPKSDEIKREDRDGGAEDGSYLHSLNVGYLDDEVVVGIGLEDTAQAFSRVKAATLLECMEACPGEMGEVRVVADAGGNGTRML